MKNGSIHIQDLVDLEPPPPPHGNEGTQIPIAPNLKPFSFPESETPRPFEDPVDLKTHIRIKTHLKITKHITALRTPSGFKFRNPHWNQETHIESTPTLYCYAPYVKNVQFIFKT